MSTKNLPLFIRMLATLELQEVQDTIDILGEKKMEIVQREVEKNLSALVEDYDVFVESKVEYKTYMRILFGINANGASAFCEKNLILKEKYKSFLKEENVA